MHTVITDAGRADAGYSPERLMGGPARDCLVRAIALLEWRAPEHTQAEVYATVRVAIEELVGSVDAGLDWHDGEAILELFGYRKTDGVRTGIIGSKRLAHVVAVVDGVPHDTREVADVYDFDEAWVKR